MSHATHFQSPGPPHPWDSIQVACLPSPGPPGRSGGKTSLAAGFLEHGWKGAHLWFQLDEGDGDPARFFFYLQKGLERASRRRRPDLPSFGPEYVPSLNAFARSYFEALYARLPDPAVLILDDAQTLPAASPVHGILREAIGIAPRGAHFLILSRQLPPPDYARLQAGGLLDVLAWEDWRMTDPEAQGVLAHHLGEDGDPAERNEIIRLAAGWPAGLVLLAKGRPGSRTHLEAGNRALLCDYFASEVMARLAPGTRDLLLRIAFLGSCTCAQAVALTGRPGAAARLQELARTGIFLAAHGRSAPSYEYHPLFREFLLELAEATIPGEELACLRERAAGILEESGRLPEAFDLRCAQGDPRALVAMIHAHSAALLGSGQNHTLEQWLGALPADLVAADGWLSYGAGICAMPLAPERSRRHLEQAFTRFSADGQLAGQLMAWAAIVDTHLQAWDDFSALDPWIAWLDARQEAFEALPSAPVQACVTVAMVWALIHRQPDHPRIRAWVARAEALLEGGADRRLRLRAGSAAVSHHFWAGRRTLAEALATRLQRLALQKPEDPLAIQTHHWVTAGVHAWMKLPSSASRKAVTEGLAAGERSGFHAFDFLFHGLTAAWAIGAAPEQAEPALAAMERTAPGLNGRSYHHYLQAWHARLRGDRAGSAMLLERSVQEADASGMISSMTITRLAWASLLHEQGRTGEAEAQQVRLAALVARLQSPPLEGLYHLGAARRADPGAGREQHLRRGLELARSHQCLAFQWLVPEWLASVCAQALAAGQETAFVQQLIRLHRLRPPADAAQSLLWPHPLRIRTLGGFSILADGQPMTFGQKTPRKVLLLLKALLAAGPAGIGEERLADQIWPEADGDAAAQSLATTLHRLRRLLAVDGAILCRDGHLELDPAQVWVDAHAFEALAGSPGAARELYRGPFLPDLEAPWAVDYRRRLGRLRIDLSA
jgi:hypothetical protein